MSFTYESAIERVHQDWLPFFENNKKELIDILYKVNQCQEKIYPKPNNLLRAFYYHSPKDMKLFICGQDPYISEENGIPQAMGLAFSVPKKHKKIPPSLQNIYKEIKNCYPDYEIPTHGLLKRWARKEKILLLNSALTVIEKKSNSQAELWESFTDKIIKWFSEQNPGCVFLLMGGYAKKKAQIIDKNKHKIFCETHPSPLSAHNGFFGCKVFKKINDYFESKNQTAINW